MAKYKDAIDLYDDDGKLLKSNVTIDRISPVVNKGALNVIDLTKRTVAVNFAGIEDALKTGKMGGKSNQILGRSMSCSCVKDCDALTAKIKDMVQVAPGDDTKITKVGGGKMILVEVPTARMNAAATYDVASTVVAAATTYALVDQYKVGMFDGSYIKELSGVPTRRPWTCRAAMSSRSCPSRRTTKVSATHSVTFRPTTRS